MSLTIESTPCVKINVPTWYEREDFRQWLNNADLATWHRGGEPTEYSDVFMTFDHGEGSDFDHLFPEDLHEQIVETMQEHGIDYCIVWLTNLQE